MKKTPRRIRRDQPPGPDYKFRLTDLQRMVEQLGGRLRLDIYPRELDEPQMTPAAPEER